MSKDHTSQEKLSGPALLDRYRRGPENAHRDSSDSGVRILRRPEVQRRTGLSRSTIYGLMAEGLFPRPIRLGKRAVGWPDHVIDEFIESRSKTGEA